MEEEGIPLGHVGFVSYITVIALVFWVGSI